MPVVLRDKEIWVPALIVVAIMTVIFLIVRSMMAQAILPNPPAAPAEVASSQLSSVSPSPPSLPTASALDIHVFPSRNQGPDLQDADESACYSWAKDQTSIDPKMLTQKTQIAGRKIYNKAFLACMEAKGYTTK